MWKNNIIACDIQMWRMCRGESIENNYRYFHAENAFRFFGRSRTLEVKKEKRNTIVIVFEVLALYTQGVIISYSSSK